MEESPVTVAADIDVGGELDDGESEDSVSAPYVLPVEDLPSDDESTAAPRADVLVRDRGEYDGFEVRCDACVDCLLSYNVSSGTSAGTTSEEKT